MAIKELENAAELQKNWRTEVRELGGRPYFPGTEAQAQAMDGHFDITNKIDRDIRHCKTRAFAAELFAAHPRAPDIETDWTMIAQNWRALAELKARANAHKMEVERHAAAIKQQIAEVAVLIETVRELPR